VQRSAGLAKPILREPLAASTPATGSYSPRNVTSLLLHRRRFVESGENFTKSLLNHTAQLRVRENIEIVVTQCGHDSARNRLRIQSRVDECCQLCIGGWPLPQMAQT
jgi:hypothetical protein